MRTYRKRPWSSLVWNATPLIDVIFLLIIFFLLTINFSEAIIKRVNLPRADEAQEIEKNVKRISITVLSAEHIFVGMKMVPLAELEKSLFALLNERSLDPQTITLQLLGDEDVPYEVVQTVMQKIALIGITRIEFSTLKEEVPPLED